MVYVAGRQGGLEALPYLKSRLTALPPTHTSTMAPGMPWATQTVAFGAAGGGRCGEDGGCHGAGEDGGGESADAHGWSPPSVSGGW